MYCRSCMGTALISILSLGQMPLANRLLQKNHIREKEPTYNLEVLLCQDCGLLQLKDIVDPKELFIEYLYLSSVSDTIIKSAKDLTDRLIPQLTQKSMVIEIASNDGYLLQNYKDNQIKVLGIEPAKNIAKIANEKGINTLNIFFSAESAQILVSKGFSADIVHANNVMAHIPDINGFTKGIKTILKLNGLAIIEVPYLLDLVNKCEFDTIYHEHIYYFSVTSLKNIFSNHDLIITDIEKLNLHGGSLRLFVRHKGFASEESEVVKNILNREYTLQINSLEFYLEFNKNLQVIKQSLLKLLYKLKSEQKRIVAYGASAKGTTLLNFFGIDSSLLDFVVDRNQAKHGLYTPGTYLPIYSPERLIEERVDYALLLTWNFAEEILAQQVAYRRQGGKFIIPIPDLRIV